MSLPPHYPSRFASQEYLSVSPTPWPSPSDFFELPVWRRFPFLLLPPILPACALSTVGVCAPAARLLLSKRPARFLLLPTLSRPLSRAPNSLARQHPPPSPASFLRAPALSPRARPSAVLAPTRPPRSPARPPAGPPATVQWSLVESLLTSRHSPHGIGAEGRERDESEGGERECETERESWSGAERNCQ